MTEEKTKAKAPAKAADEKVKRPRLTAEQKIEQLKAQAVALETKVKEKQLAAYSKDLESYNTMVGRLTELFTKVNDQYTKLAYVADDNDSIDVLPQRPPYVPRALVEAEVSEAGE